MVGIFALPCRSESQKSRRENLASNIPLLKKKMEYSLVGFGGRPRFCLGSAFAQMEMKIFTSMLLRNYTSEILPNQNLTPEPIPTLHPKSGLKVKFASSIV